MRRLLSVIVVMTFVGLLFAQEAGHRYTSAKMSEQRDTTSQSKPTPKRRRVDFMADEVKPYQLGSDSLVYFVGNFAAHHNGAVISCDSAVRFSDTNWGFFGRVLVNQDSIYIYGDSALYDGEGSMAEIFAPIIKVVDGDALLYTYNFKFNTEERIGTYVDGGVLVHDDNIIESMRGFYNARTHDIICVDDVELHGADYDMKSDSVIYNTDTEFAHFFTSSEIWNIDGDYLSADEGYYDKAIDLYKVTRNGYILTKEQEMWGDTLEYYRQDNHVIARGNIQMDDFENKMLGFGDYAEYWSDPDNAILTRNPSTISYDTSQSDSLFLRADTMYLLTIFPYQEKQAAEQAQAAEQGAEPTEVSTPAQGVESSELPSAERAGERAIEVDAAAIDEQNPVQESSKGGDRQALMQVAQADRDESEGATAANERASQRNLSVEDIPALDSLATKAKESLAATEQIQNTPPRRNIEQSVTENQENQEQQASVSNPVQSQGNNVSAPEQTENDKASVPSPADQPALQPDSIAQDSLVQDSLALDTTNLTPKQLKARKAEQARKLKQEQKLAKAAERKAKLDSIGKARVAKVREQLEEQKAKELERMAKDSIRRAEQRAKLIAKGKDVSYLDREDSLASMRSERIRNMGALRDTTDSVAGPTYSEAPQQQEQSAEQQKADSIAPDSSYRLVKAYRNVKMFRRDAQMVCDSLTTSSQDSVVHLYINPILWNGANQLSSQFMDIYSRNQQIERAEFLGNPITVAQIDTSYYNQVTGKKMVALFRDNDIYRNDVEGNVQTIYFNREDEKTTLVTEMIYLEGASASFYIEQRELTGVTYRNDVPITMYPIDQIPPTQPLRLPNFKWTPELRPALEDVFDRVIRPSRRSDSALRERPMFDIVERMDRRKEILLGSGEWVDREDELSPEVVQWRDTREP